MYSLSSMIPLWKSKTQLRRKILVFLRMMHRIGGVMVSMLASIAVDREFKLLSSQIKDYKIGICCFSTKHPTLRRKSKEGLARNHDNVSE